MSPEAFDDAPGVAGTDPVEAVPGEEGAASDLATAGDDDPRNRRRGRRGGRRRRRDDGEISPFAVPGAEQPDLLPVYAGPTPADPFGGQAFDIFDVMDQVERQAEAAPVSRAVPASEIVNATGPEPESAPLEVASDVTPEAVRAPEVAEETHPAAAEVTEILNATAPEPSPEHLAVGSDPSAPTPANDVAPEPPPAAPVVVPILVGAGGEAPAEKKRGWWRR
jgi:ribonuclease E